jgi:HlyD family secretion protein
MKTTILLLFASAIIVLSGCSGNGKELKPSGTLEATEVSLSPLVSGRILEMRKQEGETVIKGDTLVVIDVELIGLQRNQNEAQIAELTAAYASLQSQKTQVNLQRTNFEQKLERQKELLKSGSSTQQVVDDLASQCDVLKAQESSINSQMQANLAQRARIEAGKKMFERQIRDGVMVAPSNGTILVRGSEPGESVTPQTVVYKMADLTELTVKVYLTEQEIARVKIGQKVSVIADAFSKKAFDGIVSFVNPNSEFTPKNIQTKTSRADLVFAVKINIANTSGELHAGMPVEVSL